MISFEQTSGNTVKILVDNSIYNEKVIIKVLYWLSNEYLLFQEKINERHRLICIEKKSGDFLDNEVLVLKEKLNRDFVDYKMREVIFEETKNIRDILYVKAFANNDDFEDFNLIAN